LRPEQFRALGFAMEMVTSRDSQGSTRGFQKIMMQDEDSLSDPSERSAPSVPPVAQVRPIGENLYSLLIAEITQDYIMIMRGSERKFARITRLSYSMVLILGVIALQVFLLSAISSLLCNPAVKRIRSVYSEYQVAIYGDNVEKTVNGFYRGVLGAPINEEGFQDLDMEVKWQICNVPFSQPMYTLVILLIWSLTCIAEIRPSFKLLNSLLRHTPTVKDVSHCIERNDEATTIVGLTMCMKIGLSLLCFVPRTCALLVLNFLGCRWLVSSESLEDLFLNSLALEFMVLLPELLYKTFATQRSMLRTELTFVMLGEIQELSLHDVVAAVMWASLSVIWVCVYIFYFQTVLPGYRWDVHPMCEKYIGTLEG